MITQTTIIFHFFGKFVFVGFGLKYIHDIFKLKYNRPISFYYAQVWYIESYIHSYKTINFLEMEFRSSYIPREKYAVLRLKIRKLNLNYWLVHFYKLVFTVIWDQILIIGRFVYEYIWSYFDGLWCFVTGNWCLIFFSEGRLT